MMRDVLADETGDEIVAVVIASATTQHQGVSGRSAGRLEQIRPKLGVQKLIGLTLIDP